MTEIQFAQQIAYSVAKCLTPYFNIIIALLCALLVGLVLIIMQGYKEQK